MIKIEAIAADHEAGFWDSFPAGKKNSKKLLVSVSMRYLKHLDGIPKK